MTTPASAMPKTGSQPPTQAPTPTQAQTPRAPQNVPAHPVPMQGAMPPQGMPPQQGMPHYAYVMPPAQPSQPRPPTPFSRGDWLIFALAGAEAIALLVFFNVGTGLILLPGIGLSLMIYMHLGLVALALGKKARYDRTTIPLIAATLLLGAFPTIYGNLTFRALNLLIVWVLMTITTFLMSNIWESARLRIEPFISAFTTWFLSLFSHVHRPINGMRAAWHSRTKNNPKKILPIWLGILLAIAVLCVILPLLFSADTIFAKGFEKIIYSIFIFSIPDFVVRVFILALAWPAAFGVLWGLARTQRTETTPGIVSTGSLRALRLPTATSIIVLGTLIIVYLAFIWVQAVYLFGGRESALATGSYSEYARSGFFQLVAVAAINLAVALLASYSAHNRREVEGGLSPSPLPAILVRAGIIVLLVQTGVILVSAFKRMNLYVDAYGLSILRILTYLGMAFIAVCLLIVCLYTFSRKVPVFAAIFATGIVLWAGFNLINPDARIASYNVRHYLSGDIKEIDMDYFYQLSPGVAPIVEELQGKVVSRDADDVLEYYRDEVTDAPWQAWSFAFTKADK